MAQESFREGEAHRVHAMAPTAKQQERHLKEAEKNGRKQAANRLQAGAEKDIWGNLESLA